MHRDLVLHNRPLALVCVLVLSLVGVVMAWNASPDSPSKGYSWAKLYLTKNSSPSSNRWKLEELSDEFERGWFDSEDPWNPDLFVTSVYRSRFGLFSPWLQTRQLHIRDKMAEVRPIGRNASPPTRESLLVAKRTSYRQVIEDDPSEQRRVYFVQLVAAIDTELAGGFPERRILWPALALDGLFVLAHAVLAVCVVLCARWVFRQARADHREIRRCCVHCGYDTRGLRADVALCPECGNPPRPPVQAAEPPSQ